MLPGGRHVLMTDTVGFISKLPKELINAFRATLEEIAEADLLIHVADASDPEVRDKIDSVMNIIESMECEEIPSILVFNKTDQADADTEAALREGFPQVPFVSARNGRDFKELLLYLEEFVEEADAGARLGDFKPEEEPKGSFPPPLLHSSL